MQYDSPESNDHQSRSVEASPLKKRFQARSRRRWLLWVLPLVAGGILGLVFGLAVAAAIHMPGVNSLNNFQPGLITHVRGRHGQVFATFARERRMLLRDGQVPKLLQEAVVAIEDAGFFHHGGIDAVGVMRAAVTDLRTGHFTQGASTITMQLARQLFLSRKKTWRRKIEEAFLAVELEKTFSKQQILTMYCNLIFLGHGNYGMEAAAHDYFNKSVDQLDLPEAATLAGIVQQPSRLNPFRNPDLVVHRRNEVLRRMLSVGYITKHQFEKATATPLLLAVHKPENDLGRYFAEQVRQDLESRFGTAAVLSKGLNVETTLDTEIQRAAESALRDGLLKLDHDKGWRGPLYHLKGADLSSQKLPSWTDTPVTAGSWNEGIVLAVNGNRAKVKVEDQDFTLDGSGIAWTHHQRPSRLLKKGDVAWFRLLPAGSDHLTQHVELEQEPELEGAVLVIESATGAVRALVGGWDFDRSKFDRAIQAHRQVGSAFKPFVYGAAIESGFTPADTLFDGPVVFPNAENQLVYSPRNFYRKYYGIVTLRRALEESINVTSVKLLDMVGVQRVIDFARRCGIQSPLPPYPSLALGTADLSPLELASAYAAIANHGVYLQPYFIQRVKLPSGKVLLQHRPTAHKAMEPQVSYVLTHMLEGVVDRGTASQDAGIDVDLAGKTGTTDDYSDAWFVGFTPRYTVLAWVGYDVKRSIGHNMTGARAALPIWTLVINSGLQDGWITKGGHFSIPPGITMQPIEYYTGLLPGPGAQTIIDESFLAGTQPTQVYDPKWAQILALPWYQQLPFYIPKEGERMPGQIPDWDAVKQAWKDKKGP